MKIKNLLIDKLSELLEDLRHDRIACDEEQMEAALKAIGHKPVSAYEAYTNVLRVSRATFMQWVSEGKMPKGRKRQGWKELTWYEDEVREAYDKIKQKQ